MSGNTDPVDCSRAQVIQGLINTRGRQRKNHRRALLVVTLLFVLVVAPLLVLFADTFTHLTCASFLSFRSHAPWTSGFNSPRFAGRCSTPRLVLERPWDFYDCPGQIRIVPGSPPDADGAAAIKLGDWTDRGDARRVVAFGGDFASD